MSIKLNMEGQGPAYLWPVRCAQMGITSGNLGPSKGGAVLLGDEDWLLPNIHATMMKYFAGLRAMSGPMSQSFSQCRPAQCDQVPFSECDQKVFWHCHRCIRQQGKIAVK